MTDHLRLSHLRTTTQLFKQTTSTFTSNLFTFLFLSFLLFSFRTLVENGTHLLTSFIDRDASLKSLLSRLDLAGHHQELQQQDLHHRLRHHRRPFLHLTRVGTLDDDFFSGDDDTDRALFGHQRKSSVNASYVILSNFDTRLGFSDLVVDNGIRFPEIVRTGITFKAPISHFDKESDDFSNFNNEDGINTDEQHNKEKENGSVNLEKGGQDFERIVDLQFFIKGLELGRRDAAALFFLVSLLSAAYGWVIIGFIAIYSWVLGVVFITVVNDLLGRFSSFVGLLWDGSKLGLKRLTGFILMRWAVRDALTQLLGLWYFGEIEDQYSFFKLFVRLKLMPFSVMSPWIRGFEKEISGFLFTWFLLDTFVSFIFALDGWIAIVDHRRSGREIVKEGCYLILTMMNKAIKIKCFEAILCGSFARWVLTMLFGKFLAAIFQSAVEVYFMVAWLIFYFVARSRDANSEGRRFGRRELEGLIEGLR
ncbi:hypothetical protein HS088_TW05G00605 [Tripterygium wilfordii]|uniref:Transmembrane protein n=1 Tax=Tripterygium wilfordii TaxID=458696 RepID=A0A7J7DND8_TRIWF|nr:uncharacterized protein LOC119998786 [Tripterygium wilfordii]KAF5747875.1 hypothetical protein HS088_TW05G00605 [Tripterygium wilfordii]